MTKSHAPEDQKKTKERRFHRVPDWCDCGRKASRAGQVLKSHPPLSATACERCAKLEATDMTTWEKCGSDKLVISERDAFWDVRDACDRWLRARGIKEIPFNGFKVAC